MAGHLLGAGHFCAPSLPSKEQETELPRAGPSIHGWAAVRRRPRLLGHGAPKGQGVQPHPHPRPESPAPSPGAVSQRATGAGVGVGLSRPELCARCHGAAMALPRRRLLGRSQDTSSLRQGSLSGPARPSPLRDCSQSPSPPPPGPWPTHRLLGVHARMSLPHLATHTAHRCTPAQVHPHTAPTERSTHARTRTQSATCTHTHSHARREAEMQRPLHWSPQELHVHLQGEVGGKTSVQGFSSETHLGSQGR